MALVSVTEAARLVRRGRASLYRDIEKGRLSKTVTPNGETGIETSELIRAYGNLYLDETSRDSHVTSDSSGIEDFSRKVNAWKPTETVSRAQGETSGDDVGTSLLEEKIRSYEHRIELLERIVDLEKTVRQDTTAALKAQLADKETVIKALENQVLMLGYTKPTAPEEKEEVRVMRRPKGWLARLFKKT